MEIERVNEYTVKFFISYRDIEDRGFEREEIWYDRERGEELFWEMMDEAANEGEFEMDGPLWIQVQAFEKGLEIIVTKAKLSHDGSKLELPISDNEEAEISIEYQADQTSGNHELDSDENQKDGGELKKNATKKERSYLITFNDFEDVINLAHDMHVENLTSDLYVLDDVYYMYITFDEDAANEMMDQLSVVLEFGIKSKITIHRAQEYGKLLMEKTALQQLKSYFPQA